ncbi:MAG: ribonuclease Z [Methermicoccaceae archaeon]
MLRVTFLGTSGALPTVDRNPSAIILSTDHESLLLDCGEGAQQQMMRSKVGFGKLSSILVTHTHADHILGIPGLLQTLAFFGREDPITIYGPKGIARLEGVFTLMGTFTPPYELSIKEVMPGDEIRVHRYTVRVFETVHSTISVGYAIVEDERCGRFNRKKAELELGIPPGPLYSKLQRGESIEWKGRIIHSSEVVGPPRRGRMVVYTGDTRPCETVVKAAQGADLLIHDGMFTSEHAKLATEVMHSTAAEAAMIARQAKVRQLVITHISARHSENERKLLREAREEFKNSLVARDLMSMDIPFPDQ